MEIQHIQKNLNTIRKSEVKWNTTILDSDAYKQIRFIHASLCHNNDSNDYDYDDVDSDIANDMTMMIMMTMPVIMAMGTKMKITKESFS